MPEKLEEEKKKSPSITKNILLKMLTRVSKYLNGSNRSWWMAEWFAVSVWGEHVLKIDSCTWERMCVLNPIAAGSP